MATSVPWFEFNGTAPEAGDEEESESAEHDGLMIAIRTKANEVQEENLARILLFTDTYGSREVLTTTRRGSKMTRKQRKEKQCERRAGQMTLSQCHQERHVFSFPAST